MQTVLPSNKVNSVNRKGCVDVYIYSNKLTNLMGWRWDGGPKDVQGVGVPEWIKEKSNYARACLRGLFQTDGSVYLDRGYTMANFVNTCERLAKDTMDLIELLGYKPNLQILHPGQSKVNKTKYTVRICKSASDFIREIGYWKA